ncbi:hypothetical protein AYO46_00975 [Betaproteobacteria bacterium SCGC AG-212-J23]|nr:hypothetical protein AYO46_00975 [Betaproteobacteria bacterium SCGC AG-212-J23]
MDPRVVGGATAVGTFVGILLALKLGRWLGQRAIASDGRAVQPNVGSLEAAVFALLGLLIAFTFSGALQRFDSRRVQVVQEANSIGTAWSHLSLLPAAAQPKLRDTFRAYVDARIAAYRVLPDIEGAKAALSLAKELQGEIWEQAVAATQRKDATQAATIVLMPQLQDMFSLATARLAATQIHPPTVIYEMLIALALVAALLAGYQAAGERGYDWIHKIAFAGIVSATVYLILDIEYPRLGFIRIDAIDKVLLDVRAGMK